MASFPRRLAIDIGASAIRGIELGPDQRGNPSLLNWHQAEMAFDPGKTSDLFPQLLQAMQQVVQRLSTRTKHASLCLGGPAVFSRVIKVPITDPTKLDSIVRFEAQQTVPAIEQATWDFQILPGITPGETEVFLLAIKKETVDEAVAAASGSGLVVDRVDLVPSALLNAFRFNYPEETGVSLILEIGARASTILLTDGSRVLSRVVPLGGATVSQAVSTDLQESFLGAETLKLAKGFVHPGGAYEDPPDATAARISKLARGVMTRLHTEVERSITFFRSQQGGDRPQQVFLAGGGSVFGYTQMFFQEKLKVPVQFFQPFRRIAIAGGGSAEELGRNFPAWAVAMGAGLGSLPNSPCRIDVLGGENRAAFERGQNRPAQIALIAAVVALLFFPAIHGFWQSVRIRSQLASKAGQVEKAEAVLEQIGKKNRNFEALAENLEKAARLQEMRLRWLGLVEELQAKAPNGLWITELAVMPGNAEENPPAGLKKPMPATLEIGGMFETRSEEADAKAVEEFVKSLNTGGCLNNVEVVEREAPNYLSGKTEQVALKFRLRAKWSEAPLSDFELNVSPGKRQP